MVTDDLQQAKDRIALAMWAEGVWAVVERAAANLGIDPGPAVDAIDWAQQVPPGPRGEVDERQVIRTLAAWFYSEQQA